MAIITPQVPASFTPSAVIQPPTVYALAYAVEMVNILNADEDDDWSYEIEMVAEDKARILAIDEDGEAFHF